jgi:antitoxin (DNA-binding transcriptional repressor) of toxin-antitoxin stability system
MTNISIPEFSRDVEGVILKVQQGETVVLTAEGKPSIKLEAVQQPSTSDAAANPIKTFCDIAKMWTPDEPTAQLSNEDMDRIIYGL